tara:strand:+ start:2929 stop:3537 length:609 start_codon:yes stop_codon:yes gene_type:complete
MRRKTMKRKVQLKTGRKNMKRGGRIGTQCGNVWTSTHMGQTYDHLIGAKNVNKGLKAHTTYDIEMKYYRKAIEDIKTFRDSKPNINNKCKIYGLKIKDIEKIRDDLKGEFEILKTFKFSNIYIYGGVNSCKKRFREIDDFFKEIQNLQPHGFLDKIKNMGFEVEILSRRELLQRTLADSQKLTSNTARFLNTATQLRDRRKL